MSQPRVAPALAVQDVRAPLDQPVLQKKRPAAPQKKRRSMLDDPDDQSAPQQRPSDEPKKKKAARACFHCQKAHLTCDDSRPCKRCVKRGMGDQCTEGHRKKAKYLLEDGELEELTRNRTTSAAGGSIPNGQQIQSDFMTQNDDPLYGMSFDPQFPYGSSAASLDYNMLSEILSKTVSDPTSSLTPNFPSFDQSSVNVNSQRFSNPSWPAESPTTDNSMGANQLMSAAAQPIVSPNAGNTYNVPRPYGSQSQFGQDPNSIGSLLQSAQQQNQMQEIAQYPSSLSYQQRQAPSPVNSQRSPFSASYTEMSPQQQQMNAAVDMSGMRNRATSQFSPPNMVESPLTSAASPISSSGILENGGIVQARRSHTPAITAPGRPQSTHFDYNAVNSKYNYTESYHFLMSFLKQSVPFILPGPYGRVRTHVSRRFEKNDILRVVRALAIFRPSLIALQTPLSEEDEIFVERCFQRSLEELKKLISFSGTPTVVWRRTGEVCHAGAEFYALTEWTEAELMGGKKYIYELFENQSVVEYWEKFAMHAFENTTQSVYSHCVLLKPSGEPVPCAFCFSIRRDIFDLPSIVIGQWLPLL